MKQLMLTNVLPFSSLITVKNKLVYIIIDANKIIVSH